MTRANDPCDFSDVCFKMGLARISFSLCSASWLCAMSPENESARQQCISCPSSYSLEKQSLTLLFENDCSEGRPACHQLTGSALGGGGVEQQHLETLSLKVFLPPVNTDFADNSVDVLQPLKTMKL